MTDRLREVFDDLLAGEPPLRTSADDTVAAGRILRNRRRRVWTVAGAALAVAAVAVVPRIVTQPSGGAGPTAMESTLAGSPSPTSTSHTPPLNQYEHCPSNVTARLDRTDGSVLPDPARAAAAVLAAGPVIAPGRTFIVHTSIRVDTSDKAAGIPIVYLIFDIGDADGFGSINIQIMPEVGATAVARAEMGLNTSACVDVSRRDFPDASVAVYYPNGPPEQEREVMHVWYYAERGFTMNIGCFPKSWSANDDPNSPAPPPPRPVRTDMPLTISQIMEVADIVARSG